jgi:hypothetical protein
MKLFEAIDFKRNFLTELLDLVYVTTDSKLVQRLEVYAERYIYSNNQFNIYVYLIFDNLKGLFPESVYKEKMRLLL